MTETKANSQFIHEAVLSNKVKNTSDADLKKCLDKYNDFRKKVKNLRVTDKKTLYAFMKEFNAYRKYTIPLLEPRSNSGQEDLRSTILEELFQHIFNDLIQSKLKGIPDSLFSGSGSNSYVSLCFTPKNFFQIFSEPNPYVHTKDQDFVLGCLVNISVNAKGFQNKTFNNLVIPIVAIECKTYIERNMLDSCAGTATRLKTAMPYCIYIVASEYLKMEDSQPELTDIDEVYILCKSSNSERLERARRGLEPHEIDPELIYDLFDRVRNHINRTWWSPEEALHNGRIIGRP